MSVLGANLSCRSEVERLPAKETRILNLESACGAPVHMRVARPCVWINGETGWVEDQRVWGRVTSLRRCW